MKETGSTREEMGIMIRLALPVVGAQIAMIGLSTTDVVMSGRLGEDVLAGVGLGNAICNPVWIFFMGVIMAVNPIVAQLFGAGRFGEIGSQFRQGLWMAVFLTIPGLFALWFPGPVLEWMKIPTELGETVSGYLRAWSWGLPFCLAFFAVRFFCEGLSTTRPPMFIMIAAIPLNVAANYVLMYGKLGFPALGARGAGYATSLVWCFAFISLFVWTLRHRPFAKYELVSQTKPRWQQLQECFRIGLPNGVSAGVEIVMFALVTLYLGRMGSEAVSAHQIAINVASVTFMLSLGISTGVSIRIGQAVGRRSAEGVLRAGKAAFAVGFLTNSSATVLMIGLRNVLPGFYTAEPGVQETAATLLFYAGVFQLSDGIQVTAMGALRGLKDTGLPMLSNFFSYWLIGIPTGYYLGIVRGLGPPGFWYGLITGLSVAAVLHTARFLYLLRANRALGESAENRLDPLP